MRLRRLEIQGFKSFPDKTVLTFEHPITAVVGPNGSGKSNIADAVRWVLGEQSSKTLRGGKMEDVIFSGTQSRGSVGYAHVQLVIDNSGLELSEHGEEIIISRRLYRSGESEYRLDGAAVRLKDIHELLMDTGLGRDGYSIIGQGRISEIVSAKSRERREIFEEAAGISKFRYRKEEAERRLVQAEENLVRLRDILLELSERVGPLKEQSAKAKEFLVLSEEKKTLEISLWMSSLSVLREQVSSQEDKVFVCKNQYEALENESAGHEQEIESTYRRIQSLDAQSEEKRAAVGALEERMAAAGSQCAVLQNDIRHNEQNILRLTQELQSADLSADELKAQFYAKEAELEEQGKDFAALESKVEAARQRLEEQREQAAKVNGELDSLVIRREAAARTILEARLSKASSETALAESASRLETLSQSSAAHDSAVWELERSIAECEKLRGEEEEKAAGLQNSARGYILKREGKRRETAALLEKAQKLQNDAQDARRRARLLEELEQNMEGVAASVKYILGQAKKGAISGVIGAVSSLVSTDEKYNLAIETALGPAMQNIVVENDDVAKRAIRMLRDTKSGRATFLPLNTVRGRAAPDLSAVKRQEGFIGLASDLLRFDSRLQKIIEQLLGRVCVAEDLNRAGAIAKASGYSLRVVTLDGQVVGAGGSFTGGSSFKGAGTLGRRGEIEKLTALAVSLEKEAQELEPQRKSVTEEISAMDAAISGIEAEIKTAQEEIVRLGATEAQMKRNLETAKQNRALAQKELELLRVRLESLKEGEADADLLMRELESELAGLDARIEAASRRRETLSIGAETAAAALADQNLLKLSATKDLERLSLEVERSKNALDTAGERGRELKERRASLERENEKTVEKIAELEEENRRDIGEKGRLQEIIARCSAQRTELEAKITALHAAEREVSGNRERIARELATLEARKVSLQGDYDAVIAKLWDEYELTRSQAAELAVELENKEKAERRLGELRSKIRGLGSVNVAAIEEYKQVNVRYVFLAAQVSDAEQAKAQLSELIGSLTDEMRLLFNDNFQKIALHFSKIFVQLFGGGKAELTLTGDEDVLESGVEIYVQPPGKIIKNLSLLSGGEQAFVAIAIYFAILKVRPSPFCLLDEIEAALDDVNVVKFANYLRQMSKSTQFIAITHRRGTMEEADVLYGVTMQDEGVSKLLELAVGEVETLVVGK